MVKIFRFTAEWCNPCKMLAKVLEQEGIDIPTIDVDKNKELAAKYGIRSIPAIIIEQPNGSFEVISGSSLSNNHKDMLHAILDASESRS